MNELMSPEVRQILNDPKRRDLLLKAYRIRKLREAGLLPSRPNDRDASAGRADQAGHDRQGRPTPP